MRETGIEKKAPAPLKEKGQYALGFSVIALMLYFAGFPIFLLFFVGVLAFFIWKVFSSESRTETRRIFEFYLSANEILREDDRRWYGFEIQETIARGEAVVRSMSAAPPLVFFGIGALYQKLGDHRLAVKNLSQVVEGSASTETAVVFPTKELREYVRILRKIERFPAEAPLTSAAVRSLERARKNRGQALLDHSRSLLEKEVHELPQGEQRPESIVDAAEYHVVSEKIGDDTNSEDDVAAIPDFPPHTSFAYNDMGKRPEGKGQEPDSSHSDRKTISEVLHDIYDKNIQ